MNVKLFLLAVICIIVLIICPAIACSSIKTSVVSLKPEVRDITHQWGEITKSTTELVTTVEIYNPNRFTLPIKSIVCDVKVDDIPIGHAENKTLHISKKAESQIIIRTQIDNSKIPELWISHLYRDEKSTINIDASITFDLKIKDFIFHHHLQRPLETDLLSTLDKTVPWNIEKTTDLPLIGKTTIFKITIDSLASSWGKGNPEHTKLNLFATIYNGNPYPLPIPQVNYDVELGSVTLAKGKYAVNSLLPPYSNKTIDSVILLDNSHLSNAFVQHIRNGETSNLIISASLIFELPNEVAVTTGNNKFAIPVWEGSKYIDTDILKNNADN